MKGVFVFLAEGFEEIEALSALDALRRAAVAVQSVAVPCDGQPDTTLVRGAHGIPVTADLTFSQWCAETAGGSEGPSDLMIFPGGLPGAKNLASCKILMEKMKAHFQAGGTVAAICAAPGLVVSQLDGLRGCRFTCYDGFEDAPAAKGAVYEKAPVVVDGRLITGRGPGYAWDFALALVGRATSAGTAEKVRLGLFME